MRMCIATVLAVCVLSAAVVPTATGAAAPAKTGAAAALEQRVDLDFEKTSLENVLAYIDEVRRDLEIVIDPAVAEAGIDLSTRVVDLRVKQVAVRSVLDLVLGDDLAFVPRETDVLITTRRAAQRRLVTRTYPVGGLVTDLARAQNWVPTDATPSGPEDDLLFLIEWVTSFHAQGPVAEWNREGGGSATVAVDGSDLVVSQTRAGHDVIAALLPALEKAMEAADRQRARTGVAAQQPVVFLEGPPSRGKETERQLRERIDLDFQKTSLDNVLRYISEVQRGLNVVIDPKLLEVGIDLSTRVVDLRVKQVSVRAVLDLLLDPDLGYEVYPGYVLVTTREASRRPRVRLYPVADMLKALLFAARQSVPTAEAAWCAAALQDIIQSAVDAEVFPRVSVWADLGGQAFLDSVAGILVVDQSREGHRRIANLLEQLRAVMAADVAPAGQPAGRPAGATFAESEAVAKTRRRLEQRISLDFERTSLDNVLNYIGEVQRGLNIILSPSIGASGIDPTAILVDLKVKAMPVGRVLERVCGPKLTFSVGPGYVLVLPPEELPMRLQVYSADAIPSDLSAADARDGFRRAFATVVGDLRAEGGPPAVDRIAAWAEDEGRAFVGLFGEALIVRQTEEGHRLVRETLRQLREPSARRR